jgi:predicted nucleic acid-binding protein
LSDVLTGSAPINPTVEDYQAAVRSLARFADQKITLFDATLSAVADRLGVPV